MFKRTVRGYNPRIVRSAVHNLEAKIEELRVVVSELEADNTALRKERPRDMILEARWEAEKIVLGAKAEAADMLRLAVFRRDLIIATADRSVSSAIDLTDDDEPAVRIAG
ncbi:MAG: hypothetical protein KJN71_06055 [Acidimicrobiia bacterium]|nr:hypothetical protein [Acidimicrobiia bacterium]